MLYVVSNVPAEVQTQKSIDAFYAKTGLLLCWLRLLALGERDSWRVCPLPS